MAVLEHLVAEVKAEWVEEEVKEEEADVDWYRNYFTNSSCTNLQRVNGNKPRPPDASYAARVPLWIDQCLEFQSGGKPWTPSYPCCYPNFFLWPRAGPDKEDKIACFHRLPKIQKKHMRFYIESGKADWRFTTKKYNHMFWKLLHPEWLVELRKRRAARAQAFMEIVFASRIPPRPN